MGNIVDYINQFKDVTFDEMPFKREDALCLAQFSYIKFDKIMEEMDDKVYSLQEIDKSEYRESLFLNKPHEKDNRVLFDTFLQSERFKDMKICAYINRVDKKTETQFSAITIFLPNGNTIVIFRGTDENIVGWQEDVNLALKKPVSGQKLSARYLNDVASRIKGDFIVAGHSKGGNLAMYSAMCCKEEVSKRITKIYSFDGPGFRKTFLEENNYDRIKDKVERIIPKSSYVGLMLASDKDHMVVEAKDIGIYQHFPFNWIIEDGHFIESKLSEQHVKLLEAFNQCLLSLDDEGTKKFVKFLNDLMDYTEAETTRDLTTDAMKHMASVIRNSKDIDDETRKFMSLFVKSYFETVAEGVAKEMKDKEIQFRKNVELYFENQKAELESLKNKTIKKGK